MKDIMDKRGIDYIDFKRAVRMTTRKFEDNVVSFLDQWYAEEKVMKMRREG
jgi:hypothetical protein